MKPFSLMLVLLMLFTAACKPEPIPSTPALVPGVEKPENSPQFKQPTALETTTPEPSSVSDTLRKDVANSHSESGKQDVPITWILDPGIRLEDGNVPYVLRLEDGGFRMFYGSSGGILSAISKDGLSFEKEPGIRVQPGDPGGAETIINDPTVIRLNGGGFRMYYKGATGPGGPDRSTNTVFSAFSTDGLTFQKEGVRIDPSKTADRGWASVPEAIVLPDGRVRVYYVSNGLDVKHGIVSAVSNDGLNFTREGPVLTGFVDPSIIRLDDGSYLMLAIAFPESGASPGIYSFTSRDGLTFGNRRLVLAGQNNIDPAIVSSGDGEYRVYYWNITDQPPAIKSLGGETFSVSAETTVPAPSVELPNIVPLGSKKEITGGKVWLFAIDDGNPKVALSTESDGKVIMGRLDLADSAAQVSWQTVASPEDTGGLSIADHWHIFAHGYHWIVFSVAGDSASYLLKLDADFRRIALVPVGHTEGPTNDMFLVAEPDGVAVGHFVPGFGHAVHRFDTQGKKIGQVRIGGGMYTHSNGSSAIATEGGYLLFATESLNPFTSGAVKLIKFDSSWRPIGVKTILQEPGTNAAMATAIQLDSSYLVVNLRVRTGVSLTQNPFSPSQPGLLPDDSGSLVRLIMTPDGTIVSRETLSSEGNNRPHTTLVGDQLITTWDSNSRVFLRIDRIQ